MLFSTRFGIVFWQWRRDAAGIARHGMQAGYSLLGSYCTIVLDAVTRILRDDSALLSRPLSLSADCEPQPLRSTCQHTVSFCHHVTKGRACMVRCAQPILHCLYYIAVPPSPGLEVSHYSTVRPPPAQLTAHACSIRPLPAHLPYLHAMPMRAVVRAGNAPARRSAQPRALLNTPRVRVPFMMLCRRRHGWTCCGRAPSPRRYLADPGSRRG